MTDNPTPASELDGKTLGQYEIQKQLGQGGMATVYLANQKSIGRTVAIKVMPSYFMHDPNFLQRFEREVQVIARLQHPRILPVYDYGSVEGRPFIVMAFMPGGTLADRMEQGALSMNEILRTVEQIAEGLDFAHREGIVHRDFKPSNVLLDRGGNAHLADFGIAKVSESTVALTGSGVVGTPAYMAPEMASEGLVTPAVDIYALGVTLYQMLTGRYPYSGDTPLRVMMAHATEPVPDVRTIRADVPQPVADVVRRAMAKDPADRYAMAGDLAKALRAAASGQAVPSGPEATIIESVPGYGAARPTTPPPPVYTPPGSYTPPPTPTGAPTPSMPGVPYPVPAQEKKGGCRPWMIIGAVIGVIALVACLGLGGVGAFMAFIGNPTPTAVIPTPFIPTPEPATNTPLVPTIAPTVDNTTGGATGGATGGDTGGTDGSTGTGHVLYIGNDSNVPLCYVYLAESDDLSSWGDDQLGSSDVIGAATTYQLTDIPTGTYDIMTEDCDRNVVSWNYQVNIDQDITLTVSGSSDQLIVENTSTSQICAVYISPPDAETWGRSQLHDGHPLPTGESRSFSVTAELWDLRAETCDGDEVERYGEDLTGTTTWTLSDE